MRDRHPRAWIAVFIIALAAPAGAAAQSTSPASPTTTPTTTTAPAPLSAEELAAARYRHSRAGAAERSRLRVARRATRAADDLRAAFDVGGARPVQAEAKPRAPARVRAVGAGSDLLLPMFGGIAFVLLVGVTLGVRRFAPASSAFPGTSAKSRWARRAELVVLAVLVFALLSTVAFIALSVAVSG